MKPDSMLIKIRFNTDTIKTPERNLPEWRVIYGGKEFLARSLRIHTESWSTCDEIGPGILKWHITTEGFPVWNNDLDEVVISASHSE